MERSVEETGAKMDALGLWDSLAPYNWAVKPYDGISNWRILSITLLEVGLG